MEKNFEPTIEMSEAEKAHAEGSEELTPQELTGDALSGIEEAIETSEKEKTIETFEDVVDHIKNTYGKEIKEGYLESAKKKFDLKISNPDFTREQAVTGAMNELLEKIGETKSEEEEIKYANRLYQKTEPMVIKYRNKEVTLETTLNQINEALEAVKKTSEKNQSKMTDSLNAWKKELENDKYEKFIGDEKIISREIHRLVRDFDKISSREREESKTNIKKMIKTFVQSNRDNQDIIKTAGTWLDTIDNIKPSS